MGLEFGYPQVNVPDSMKFLKGKYDIEASIYLPDEFTIRSTDSFNIVNEIFHAKAGFSAEGASRKNFVYAATKEKCGGYKFLNSTPVENQGYCHWISCHFILQHFIVVCIGAEPLGLE